MANTTINLNRSAASGSYIIGRIVCDATADYGLNNSDVTCRIYVRKANDSTTLTIPTSGTWNYSMTINGKAFSGSVSKDVLLDWVLLATVSVSDIAHNGDGTKRITISGSVTAPTGTNLSGHKSSGSGTFTLETVPRASIITTAAETTLGDYCNVKWTPLSSTFRYKLKFSLGAWTSESSIIYPGNTNAYTYRAIMPLDIARQFPNATESTMTVTLYTYSDSNATVQVGSADTETFKVTVPNNDSTRPTVAMNLVPVSSLSELFSALYIQGKSKVKATISGAGKYGASISSYRMEAEGKSYDSSHGFTSDYLFQYGTITVKGYATDSRGFTGSVSVEIMVIPYIAPKITVLECGRCDADGNPSDSGTYLKIKARRTYSKVEDSSGTQKNTCRIQYRYMVEGGSYSNWATILPAESQSDDVEIVLLNGTLSAASTYIVQVGVIDSIGEYSNTAYAVHSEAVFMHRRAGGRGMGLGKYCDEDDLLDVEWNARIRGELRLKNGNPVNDFVTETGTKDGWIYIKRSSGLTEAWYYESLGDIDLTTNMASGVYSNEACNHKELPLPSGLFEGRIYHVSANVQSNGYTLCQVAGQNLTNKTVTYRIWSPYSSAAKNLVISIYCVGR